MAATTKKQWTAAYNELTENPVKSFRTATEAEESFRGLAASMGISWTVALEGDIVLEEPDTGPDYDDEIAAAMHGRPLPVPETSEPEETTPPPASPEKGAGEKSPGRRARESDTDVIAVMVSNPKRPNSLSFARFAIYTTGITVAEFLAKGGRRADLKWDADHGFVRIHSAEDWVASTETPSQEEETASADVPADA